MKLSFLEWMTIMLMGYGIYHILQLYYSDLPVFLAGEQVYVVSYDSIGTVMLSSGTFKRVYGRHPKDTTWISMPLQYIGNVLNKDDLKLLSSQIQNEGIDIDTYITKGGDSLLVPNRDESLLRKSIRGLSINYSLSFIPFILFFSIRLLVIGWRRYVRIRYGDKTDPDY